MLLPCAGLVVAMMMCAFVLTTSFLVGVFNRATQSVLLSDVSAITLKEGAMTSGRRSSPIPQLTCVGGTAKRYYSPKQVTCYSRGSDGYDIQWQCIAEGMPTSFRFGSVDVTCEGYDYPGDPYILRGSCGLEYTLDLTEEGYTLLGGAPLGMESRSVLSGSLPLGLALVAVLVYAVYAKRRAAINKRSSDSQRRPITMGSDQSQPQSPSNGDANADGECRNRRCLNGNEAPPPYSECVKGRSNLQPSCPDWDSGDSPPSDCFGGDDTGTEDIQNYSRNLGADSPPPYEDCVTGDHSQRPPQDMAGNGMPPPFGFHPEFVQGNDGGSGDNSYVGSIPPNTSTHAGTCHLGCAPPNTESHDCTCHFDSTTPNTETHACTCHFGSTAPNNGTCTPSGWLFQLLARLYNRCNNATSPNIRTHVCTCRPSGWFSKLLAHLHNTYCKNAASPNTNTHVCTCRPAGWFFQLLARLYNHCNNYNAAAGCGCGSGGRSSWWNFGSGRRSCGSGSSSWWRWGSSSGSNGSGCRSSGWGSGWRPWSSGWGSGGRSSGWKFDWGGGASPGGSTSGVKSILSSGTRIASGFAGTKRR